MSLHSLTYQTLATSPENRAALQKLADGYRAEANAADLMAAGFPLAIDGMQALLQYTQSHSEKLRAQAANIERALRETST